MFTSIIIDDEPKCIESIQFVIEKYCKNVKVIATAKNSEDAHDILSKYNPDILILDIEMPYANGFDLLSKYTGRFFEVIFITAYENFAIRAFKVDAIDYILKPFTPDDIISAINKATTRVQEKKLTDNTSPKWPVPLSSKRIAFPTMEGLVFINIDDVIRCEASENYTTFHLANKKNVVVCKSLSEYEEILRPFDFHRIHQSHLINLAYIQKYIKGRGGYVVLSDGIKIDVSARKKMSFLEKIIR